MNVKIAGVAECKPLNKIGMKNVVLNMSGRITMMDIHIDNLSFAETIEVVDQYIKHKRPLHLMGVNADKINMSNKNPVLKRIVNECEVINADGGSVVWASRVLKKSLKERVAGIDLMQSLAALAEKKSYSIYLLGAKQEVVVKTAEVLKKDFPKLKIAGIRNGYFGKEEWKNVGEEIRKVNPDIVFVGISSPLKEYLVEYMQKNEELNSVFMGVGGSFDVISGVIKRAPLWMQKANLEWLFRVMQEPKRLFKRYFVGNWEFIGRVIKEKYKKSVHSITEK